MKIKNYKILQDIIYNQVFIKNFLEYFFEKLK